MEEIDRVHKNWLIISNIKKFSQLKGCIGYKNNNVMINIINNWLHKSLYERKGREEEVEFFYEYWTENKWGYMLKT